MYCTTLELLNRTEQNRTEQNRTEQDRTEQNSRNRNKQKQTLEGGRKRRDIPSRLSHALPGAGKRGAVTTHELGTRVWAEMSSVKV